MVEEIGSDTYLRLGLARTTAPSREIIAIVEDLKEDIPELDLGKGSEITIVGRFEPTVDLKVGDCFTVTLKRGVLCLFETESGIWFE
jgi:hypothetical protein